MPLGKLSEYTKYFDPRGINQNLKGPKAFEKAMAALVDDHQMAAVQYFLRVRGSVLINDSPGVHTALLGYENDLLLIAPQEALYLGFAGMNKLGFVVENRVTRALEIYDPAANSDGGGKKSHGGLEYELVGAHGGQQVYARLDRTAIKQLQAGRGLTDKQLNQYETSMRKGVIPSGSTGSDGIKYDHSTWVIKVTISIAQANGMDNTLSPLATSAQVGSDIFLNFNQLTSRH